MREQGESKEKGKKGAKGEKGDEGARNGVTVLRICFVLTSSEVFQTFQHDMFC